jgi:hypothetical protein
MSNPLEDNSPADYMTARGIWQRCRESLVSLDPSNPIFDSVAALCVIARAEMEKQASFLPY